jgi:hypothetical protein
MRVSNPGRFYGTRCRLSGTGLWRRPSFERGEFFRVFLVPWDDATIKGQYLERRHREMLSFSFVRFLPLRGWIVV